MCFVNLFFTVVILTQNINKPIAQQEMLYILDSMEEIKMRLLTDDYGKHLMGVEDLLQKHALVEADINVLGERVKVSELSFYYVTLYSLRSKGIL